PVSMWIYVAGVLLLLAVIQGSANFIYIMQAIEEVKQILTTTLSLGARGDALRIDTVLLGSLPELDSMGVMNVIAGLEEHFDIVVEDDEISAHTFETLGSLAAFIDQKLA
ncbi:MAG: acyl carrier protein, partial [Burkholderiaceae bacterium]